MFKKLALFLVIYLSFSFYLLGSYNNVEALIPRKNCALGKIDTATVASLEPGEIRIATVENPNYEQNAYKVTYIIQVIEQGTGNLIKEEEINPGEVKIYNDLEPSKEYFVQIKEFTKEHRYNIFSKETGSCAAGTITTKAEPKPESILVNSTAQAICSGGETVKVQTVGINNDIIRVDTGDLTSTQEAGIYANLYLDINDPRPIASDIIQGEPVEFSNNLPPGNYAVKISKITIDGQGKPVEENLCTVENIKVGPAEPEKPPEQAPPEESNPYTTPAKVVKGSNVCNVKGENIAIESKVIFDPTEQRSKLVLNIAGVPIEKVEEGYIPGTGFNRLFVKLMKGQDSLNTVLENDLCNGERCYAKLNYPKDENAKVGTMYLETPYIQDDLSKYEIEVRQDNRGLQRDDSICSISENEQQEENPNLYEALCSDVRCASNEVCSIEEIAGKQVGICVPLNRGEEYKPPETPNDYADPCEEKSNLCADNKVCVRKNNTEYICVNPTDVPDFALEPPTAPPSNPPPAGPLYEINEIIAKLYLAILPIAIAIAVIKILIALFTLATSQGDPGKLNEFKEVVFSTITGLLVIVGVSTLIKILSSAVGGI